MKTLFLVTLLTFTITISRAQINLSDKAEDKAEQVIDDLLFGKKKKKATGSSDPETAPVYTPAEEEESSSGSSDADPLGGYVAAEVDYDKLSSGAVVPFRDLINFLPNKAGNYILSQKPEGSTMKYGEWNYSFASKTLRNGDETLTVAIYDYLTAGALLAPYTQQYEYESTDGILTSVNVSEQPGWYSATYSSKATSLVLVVKNRFYLMYSGTDLSKEKLTEWATELKLNRLPEGKPAEEVSED